MFLRAPRSLRSHCRNSQPSRYAITNRGDRPRDAVRERRHRVAEAAHRLAAVERPVVAENLHRAARDERRAAEQGDTNLLASALHCADATWAPQTRPPAG